MCALKQALSVRFHLLTMEAKGEQAADHYGFTFYCGYDSSGKTLTPKINLAHFKLQIRPHQECNRKGNLHFESTVTKRPLSWMSQHNSVDESVI